MKLAFRCLNVLVFIHYAIAGECFLKEVDGCVKAMAETLEDGQPRAACRATKGVKDCYQRTINKCADELASKILARNMYKVEENIERACNVAPTHAGHNNDIDFTDEEKKKIKCGKDKAKLMPFLSQCTKQTWTESRGNISYGITPEDIGCNYFISYAHCASDKIGDFCGEFLKKSFYYKMILTSKGVDRKAAKSSICADAKKEAEMYFKKNSRKRRSLSDISFEKLLP